jgi:hypothetical protein
MRQGVRALSSCADGITGLGRRSDISRKTIVPYPKAAAVTAQLPAQQAVFDILRSVSSAQSQDS